MLLVLLLFCLSYVYILILKLLHVQILEASRRERVSLVVEHRTVSRGSWIDPLDLSGCRVVPLNTSSPYISHGPVPAGEARSTCYRLLTVTG